MIGTGQTTPGRPRVVLVTGLSGAGKSSVLHALEDFGYEAVDNPPLALLDRLIGRSERPLAVGVDVRTRGFDAGSVLDMIGRLRAGGLRPELVYAWADETALLRRYTETRRRHPLAPAGRVTDGIAAEERLTAELKEAADLVVDTSELAPLALRQLIERHFGPGSAAQGQAGLNLGLVSFAFPAGLPREADSVFDARFLRNPHYDPILRPLTGLDAEVGAYVESDPDYAAFFGMITSLLSLLLPRFIGRARNTRRSLSAAPGASPLGARRREACRLLGRSRVAAERNASGTRPRERCCYAKPSGSHRDGPAERDEDGGARPSPFRHRRPETTT